MHPKVSAATTSNELARLTIVSVIAFRLAAMYGTIHTPEGKSRGEDRLRLGYEAGRRYLEALRDDRIDKDDRYGVVPAMSFVSGQVSVDFSLGRSFEKAFVESGKMILQRDGQDVFGKEREAHCLQQIEELEQKLARELSE